MTDIRKLLASNMKNLRNVHGLSQAKLAERVDTASNYIALIETSKRFPTPKMLERIATALEVDTPELFSIKPHESNGKKAMSLIHGQILADIDQVLYKRLTEISG
jgi:transcriptional regulator with XRE-family HTH domain